MDPQRTVYLTDSHGRCLGRVSIERIEGDRVFGRFTADDDFAAVRELFHEFEAAVNDRLFSETDRLSREIDRLGLRLSDARPPWPPAGAFASDSVPTSPQPGSMQDVMNEVLNSVQPLGGRFALDASGALELRPSRPADAVTVAWIGASLELAAQPRRCLVWPLGKDVVDANGNQVFRRISGFSAGIVERCKYNNVSIDRAFGRFITQTIDAAMQSMTRRVPVTEIRILASSLMVQRKTGGSLPVTLERLLKSDY